MLKNLRFHFETSKGRGGISLEKLNLPVNAASAFAPLAANFDQSKESKKGKASPKVYI